MNRLGRAGRWMVVVVAVLLLPAVAYLWRQIGGPSDGTWIEPSRQAWHADGVAVTALEPRGDGLHTGDVVMSVDGMLLQTVAAALARPLAARPRWTVGQVATYDLRRNGQRLVIPVTLGRYPLGAVLRRVWGTIVFALVSLAVAAFVFLRRPDLPAARILLLWAAAITGATTWSFGLTIPNLIDGVQFWLFKVTTFGAYMVFTAAGLHFALIFPYHQPLLHRRGIVPALYFAPFAVTAAWAFGGDRTAGALSALGAWTDVEGAVATAYLVLVLGAIVWAYRVTTDPIGRRQIRLIILAALFSGAGSLLLWQLPGVVLGRPLIDANALGVIVLLFPIALAVAILQHRLFDIDLIINRALVYGALTAVVVTTYVVVVGYVGALLRIQDNLLLSLLATGLVALLFQPLRERVQRAVNRWMYGERDDPYTVIARLSDRLDSVVAPEAMLPALVETIAQTLKLPYVAITFVDAGGDRVAASYGLAQGEPTMLPLVYQREAIGRLVLCPRAPGEPFTADELRLLDTIATQAGAAAHAVRLTADLQQSRERLVSAREEERRRLRRDLHDGLGPALAGITLKLDAARNLLAQDPAETARLLADLKAQTQSAIADIRRLVYELRPPALDELGLVSALREQIGSLQTNGLRISLNAPDRLPPLPAAIEVAAYRITQEALTNVVRHARARECRVSISIGDALQVEIIDDGVGVSDQTRAGVGLTSMRERTAELGGTYLIEPAAGGGTRVVARFPLPGS